MISEYIPKPKKIMLIMLLGFLNFYGLGIAQELEVRFTEQMVMGDDPDAPLEYQFASPRAVETDKEGRIYVAGVNNTIRVFSPQGELVAEMGGRGRGPGEFLEITTMAIGVDGEVIIYDKRSFRVTFLHDFGDSLETYAPRGWDSEKGRQTVQKNIVPLSQNQFAITSKIRDRNFDRAPEEIDNRIVHIANRDFSAFTNSKFDIYKEKLFDPSKPLERMMATSFDYRLAKLSGDKIALTHKIYDGYINVIDMGSSGDELMKIKGNFADLQRYQLLKGSIRELMHTHYSSVSNSGMLGRFVYQRMLESEALLSNSRWLMNFVSTAEETNTAFYIEFFSPEGSYKGYTQIDDDFNVREEYKQLFYPMHLDAKNQLYYFDFSSDIPVLRITKIEVQ